MIILDGGIGRHLEKIGAPFGQPEWSALSLIQDPDFVFRAHYDFINAGADVITTNSYAIVPFHIGRSRFEQEGKVLLHKAGNIARKAAKSHKKEVKVAASIPPVFGSYKPHVFDSEKSLPILELFKNNLIQYCDLILAETLSCIDEIETVQKVFGNCKIPFWMSLTIEDEYKNNPSLRSGEELVTALGKIDFNKISSVLFNCSQPEFMAKALIVAKDVIPKNIKIGVYANAFQPIKIGQKDANSQIRGTRKELTPQKYLDFVKEWNEIEIDIVGGCCGIGPEHIKRICDFKKDTIDHSK